jgi:hypothetical protein
VVKLFHAVAVVSLFAAGAHAQTPAAPAAGAEPPSSPNDYSQAASWLCRPDGAGRAAAGKDACAIDLSATVVAADGRLTPEPFQPRAAAPIDCFYVYPTVSTDPSRHSDMTADPAEINVIAQQFARFAGQCQAYAPLYRQVTLAGLRTALAGDAASALATGRGYEDVRDAWRYYLEHDNRGRGFVLVGHSQGSFILNELIRQEIDGKPIQKQLVSAILLGTTVAVPKGRDVGGTFKNIPLCRTASQVGCVITYAAFRSTNPPPANTLFGRVSGPGADTLEGACTNPAALAGGAGQLRAYLSASGRTITGTSQPKPWVSPEANITTPFVSVPGLLTARCATNEHASFLEITVNGNPADPRVDDITGDLGLPGWGLHLIDVNLAIGNLLDIVGQQAAAYASRR